MISLSDYTAHDGLGLAELVARKQVEPEELTAAALAAIEKVNPNRVRQLLREREGLLGSRTGLVWIA